MPRRCLIAATPHYYAATLRRFRCCRLLPPLRRLRHFRCYLRLLWLADADTPLMPPDILMLALLR